jgi:hypothetical protein
MLEDEGCRTALLQHCEALLAVAHSGPLAAQVREAIAEGVRRGLLTRARATSLAALGLLHRSSSCRTWAARLALSSGIVRGQSSDAAALSDALLPPKHEVGVVLDENREAARHVMYRTGHSRVDPVVFEHMCELAADKAISPHIRGQAIVQLHQTVLRMGGNHPMVVDGRPRALAKAYVENCLASSEASQAGSHPPVGALAAALAVLSATSPLSLSSPIELGHSWSSHKTEPDVEALGLILRCAAQWAGVMPSLRLGLRHAARGALLRPPVVPEAEPSPATRALAEMLLWTADDGAALAVNGGPGWRLPPLLAADARLAASAADARQHSSLDTPLPPGALYVMELLQLFNGNISAMRRALEAEVAQASQRPWDAPPVAAGLGWQRAAVEELAFQLVPHLPLIQLLDVRMMSSAALDLACEPDSGDQLMGLQQLRSLLLQGQHAAGAVLRGPWMEALEHTCLAAHHDDGWLQAVIAGVAQAAAKRLAALDVIGEN